MPTTVPGNQTAVANKKAKWHYFQPSEIILDTSIIKYSFLSQKFWKQVH